MAERLARALFALGAAFELSHAAVTADLEEGAVLDTQALQLASEVLGSKSGAEAVQARISLYADSVGEASEPATDEDSALSGADETEDAPLDRADFVVLPSLPAGPSAGAAGPTGVASTPSRRAAQAQDDLVLDTQALQLEGVARASGAKDAGSDHADRSSGASGAEAVMDEISSEQRESSGAMLDEAGAEQSVGLAGSGTAVLDEVGGLQLNERVEGNDLDGLVPASKSAAQTDEADALRPASGVTGALGALPSSLGLALLDTEVLQLYAQGGAVDKSAAVEQTLVADKAHSLLQVGNSQAVDKAMVDSKAEYGARASTAEGSIAAEGSGAFTGNHVVVDEVGMVNDEGSSDVQVDPSGGPSGPGAA